MSRINVANTEVFYTSTIAEIYAMQQEIAQCCRELGLEMGVGPYSTYVCTYTARVGCPLLNYCIRVAQATKVECLCH
jgi:hypothetical protein